MAFREISPGEVTNNPFTMIGRDWLLVTAGDEASHNTMTISWGNLGILWNKPVATVYVRPQRYTREFVEANDRFTLAWFGEGQQREALTLLGTKSGRDGDKIAEAGLTREFLSGQPAFREAKLVLVCKKLYQQDLLEECFLDKTIPPEIYPTKDFHRMYIAVVEKVYMQELNPVLG